MKFIYVIFSFVFFYSNISYAEYVSITTKHEEIQTAYWPQRNSNSVLIWLPGGDGSFGYASKNPPKPNWLFSNLAGLENAPDIVFMDSRYGLGWKGGDLSPRRTSRHIDNVVEVVKYYKEKTQKNVYIFGHSNSSVSVGEFLNAAPENQSLIAGAIFSASRNETEVRVHLNLPVLVMAHEQDTNRWTTPSSSLALYEKIKKKMMPMFNLDSYMADMTREIQRLVGVTCMLVHSTKQQILSISLLWKQAKQSKNVNYFLWNSPNKR